MKQWIADKYIRNGTPEKQIKFEKQFYGPIINHRQTSNRPDIFIKEEGGIAIYCQTHNKYPWLYIFINSLPFIRTFSKKQIVVFPENVEALKPINMQEYFEVLTKNNIEIIIAPISVPVQNKSQIKTIFTYNALLKLCKLRDKYSPGKRLIVFIERDIEQLVCGQTKDRVER